MPQEAAQAAIIVRSDGGGETTPMRQPQAESYLLNIIKSETNRHANLKQALNDVFSGKGKDTGSYTFENRAVWHASSGNGEKSVTLFFTMDRDDAKIFAMGEHASSRSYTISDFGQRDAPFQKGQTISL